MSTEYLRTSESVSNGHPDKICDQISDAILDECLKQDPSSRVAVEASIKNHTVGILGEISTSANLNINKIVLKVLENIGHKDNIWGLDLNKIKIDNNLTTQSKDINFGVSRLDGEIGAGDQGIMFGYACSDTPEYMPLPIKLANDLMYKHSQVRKSLTNNILGPDAKSQVTLTYNKGIPTNIHTIVFSTQHSSDCNLSNVKDLVKSLILDPILPKSLLTTRTKIMINPAGPFEIGGPIADAGLTGRKIIVDTYGSAAHHGGGAFSGKDPTKVDRSGAYAARQIAKSLVAAGFSNEIEIEVSYAIGYPKPISIRVTNGFSQPIKLETNLLKYIKQYLSPKNIINQLNLQKPIYSQTSTFGHFGKNYLPWEKIIDLKKLSKINYNFAA